MSDRHPATGQVMRWLIPNHGLPGKQFALALAVQQLALDVLAEIPDGPELTAGLRKLLEAKDCFVRASLPQ